MAFGQPLHGDKVAEKRLTGLVMLTGGGNAAPTESLPPLCRKASFGLGHGIAFAFKHDAADEQIADQEADEVTAPELARYVARLPVRSALRLAPDAVGSKAAPSRRSRIS